MPMKQKSFRNKMRQYCLFKNSKEINADLSNLLLFFLRKNRVSKLPVHRGELTGHIPLSQLPPETPTQMKVKEVKHLKRKENKRDDSQKDDNEILEAGE